MGFTKMRRTKITKLHSSINSQSFSLQNFALSQLSSIEISHFRCSYCFYFCCKSKSVRLVCIRVKMLYHNHPRVAFQLFSILYCLSTHDKSFFDKAFRARRQTCRPLKLIQFTPLLLLLFIVVAVAKSYLVP